MKEVVKLVKITQQVKHGTLLCNVSIAKGLRTTTQLCRTTLLRIQAVRKCYPNCATMNTLTLEQCVIMYL